ncbi:MULTISPECIES: DUF134 domain-containing protein [unclassified Halanaerobium]|uniref:DUF134 domain-containing protein n=1 Tax=unclassified Halanaerobium TaxID=2641197 RepID=UPI000DF3702E|nr:MULTISPECIES: DUF134 domain-containing protein [unclassified Halanaerobium]RCW48311.1 putative DNA-binding protein (UPF0251 family) [Halanaerobium sp. MA284_MarDTE_T2]RCW78225.1 putative DNA-binding protein (UPF0251 family) [Halanaerobium sp. DL-01]
MARPIKDRLIQQLPEVKFFKPAGVPAHKLEIVELNMEEVESLRLKDVEGLTQAEAAEKMNVSRPTFQRVLTSARQKVAEALTCGKALHFSGGDYKLMRPGHCWRCGKKLSQSGRHRRGRQANGQTNNLCSDCEDEN